jgi:hypothetical protein
MRQDRYSVYAADERNSLLGGKAEMRHVRRGLVSDKSLESFGHGTGKPFGDQRPRYMQPAYRAGSGERKDLFRLQADTDCLKTVADHPDAVNAVTLYSCQAFLENSVLEIQQIPQDMDLYSLMLSGKFDPGEYFDTALPALLHRPLHCLRGVMVGNGQAIQPHFLRDSDHLLGSAGAV